MAQKQSLLARGGAGAVTALCLALCTQAHAQSGTAPTYISSLSDYEVRALSGTYAPTNGTSSLESVTPSEWITNDPATLDLVGVIVAWNGGAKGSGSKLFVHGGGHNDSANNGMYVFDFAGTSRPTGWQTPLNISPVSAVRASSATYADGKPTSVHTYDGVVYASHNNHIYRFGGAWYNPNGNFTGASFKMNVATNQWTQVPSYPGGGGGALTIYDPASGKIFVTMSDTLSGYFYRTNDDTWSGAKSYGSGFSFGSIGAWDPTRNRGVIVGGGTNRVMSLNFANETLSVSTLNASGATALLSREGVSAVYDQQIDAYWLFGGNRGSPGYSSIYQMNASTFGISQHTLSGSMAPSLNIDYQGSYGRFILMPQWRALGFLGTHDGPVYVVKLPGQAAALPNPPTAFTAN